MVTTSRVSDSDFGDIRLIENVPLQRKLTSEKPLPRQIHLNLIGKAAGPGGRPGGELASWPKRINC